MELFIPNTDIKMNQFFTVFKEWNLRKTMKWNSLIESIIDVGSGFLLAVAIQIFIFPFFELYPSILDSIGIALIFTVISMIRSWIWRSYFRRKYEVE